MSFMLTGCANLAKNLAKLNQDNAHWISDVEAGRYDQALIKINAHSTNTDRVMDAMNKGMVYRLQKKWDDSQKAFDSAFTLVDELRATSITETAESLLLTETSRAYEGAFFEVASLPIFQAMNYLDKKDCAATRVEARRIDELIRKDNDSKKVLPWSVFFSGLIYELLGETDQARVALKMAAQYYDKNPQHLLIEPHTTSAAGTSLTALTQMHPADGAKEPFVKNIKSKKDDKKNSQAPPAAVHINSPNVPTVLIKTLEEIQHDVKQVGYACEAIGRKPRLKRDAELWVIYHHGAMSRRIENRVTIDMGPQMGGLIPLVMPAYPPMPVLPSVSVEASSINMSDKPSDNAMPSTATTNDEAWSTDEEAKESQSMNRQAVFNLSMVANYERLARDDLADKWPAMQGRMVSRLTTRKLLTKELTKNKSEEVKDFAAFLSDISLLVTERADTRSWVLSPAAVYFGRQSLGAGKKRVMVKVGGQVINTEAMLKEGRITVINVHRVGFNNLISMWPEHP